MAQDRDQSERCRWRRHRLLSAGEVQDHEADHARYGVGRPPGAEREIFLIVDRGSAHRAKKVSDFVQTLGGKLRLFFLPPYSPDRNPDELSWKHLKVGTEGWMVVAGRAGFNRQVRSTVRQLQNDAGKIISYLSETPARIRRLRFQADFSGAHRAMATPRPFCVDQSLQRRR